MSDSKPRNNVPPQTSSGTSKSSSPAHFHAAADHRASQSGGDTVPKMQRPAKPDATSSDTVPRLATPKPAKSTGDTTVKMRTLNKPAAKASEQGQSGRVKFDSRGNPVWEWQTSTGVFETNVSEEEISKLQAAELSLAATQPVPVIANRKAAAPANKEKIRSSEDTGFNPYDSDNVTKTRGPSKQSHPALAHIANKKPPAALKPIARRNTSQPKPEGFWDKVKSKFT